MTPNKRNAKIIRLLVLNAIPTTQLTTILKLNPYLLASVNFTDLWHVWQTYTTDNTKKTVEKHSV